MAEKVEKPFPSTEAEINLWLQTLIVKLPGYQATLALTGQDITDLQDDAANFAYIIVMAQQIIDSKEAFFEFKDNLFKGATSPTPLNVPVMPIINMPQQPLPGIIKRLRDLVQRIKKAKGYTIQIGEDLGFVEDAPGSLNPNEIFADIRANAISGGRVEITFSKLGMDAMRVDFRRKGEAAFSLAGVYTSSPAVHEAPNVPPDSPESREYRGTLLKKNEPIGNASPIYTVVTTP